MKILHYIDRFDFGLGGVVQYVFQICQKLAEQGHSVSIVTGDKKDIPGDWFEHNKENTPNAYLLSHPASKFQSWLSKNQLNEFQQIASQHDVVHLHGAWDFGNLRIGKLLNKLGIPLVVSPHGMLDNWSLAEKRLKKSIFLSAFVRRYFRNATLVHCTAQAEIDQVNQNVQGIQQFHCVPPFVQPIDLNSANAELVFDAFPEISRSKPKLLFLSRIHKKKGIEFLLDAAADLKKREVEFQVIIAGPGDDAYVAELKQRSDALNVTEDVVWTGMVKDPLKTSLYLAADAFVLATYQENFGIVLAESMLAGLPVITTKGTDIYKELEEFGALIAEQDGSDIATQVEALLADKADYDERCERGKEQVAHWLSEDNILSSHLEMYKKAIDLID